ncbi:nucleotidyltransferase family protein [Pelagibacterium sp. 26DY04]|uniref:nucleotidyltransferase family protein n=1 Tax=Pelagibacterium sp. 26DY04 TaxID=2967130 RepID=UPI002815FF9D|nr:nucleotidyltransferase family protein [Pelagibacterium sp. 26DY04]WMT87262.1 nucleotidyltransferase family protein [Pelagibacterium sp. 26DY04]
MTDSFAAPATPMPEVMLLAAGLGTRMRPLTFERPKALIELAGKPLIDYAIDAALAEGCKAFAINMHHKAELIAAHFERLAKGLPDIGFALSDESDRLLDTGGGLRKALPLLASDPVLVLNTDTFWLPGSDRPLQRMVERFSRGDADIVLLCVAPDRASGFRKAADYLLNADGVLSNSEGRPVVYAGAALISRALAGTGPDAPFSLYRHFETAREAGRLKGVMIEAPWFHVGDPQALARTEQDIGAVV